MIDSIQLLLFIGQNPWRGWLLFVAGVALYLLVARQQFNRRGVGGLQHFDSFFLGLLILFLEWLLRIGAIVLMVTGFIKIIT